MVLAFIYTRKLFRFLCRGLSIIRDICHYEVLAALVACFVNLMPKYMFMVLIELKYNKIHVQKFLCYLYVNILCNFIAIFVMFVHVK